MGLYPCSVDVVIYIVCIRTKNCNKLPDPKYCGFARILVLRRFYLEELPRKSTTPSTSLVRNHEMIVFVKGLMGKKEKMQKKKKLYKLLHNPIGGGFHVFLFIPILESHALPNDVRITRLGSAPDS